MPTKENKTFTMPGAEPDDLDLEENKNIDLSFMEETDEEKEAREAAEERKAARQKAIEDEEKEKEAAKEAAKKEQEEADRLAAEAKEAEKNKGKKEDELTDEEKAEAAKLAASREEKDKTKKQPMVPKTRLDEVLAKNKDLQAKLDAEVAARKSSVPEVKDADKVDLDKLEDDYMEAVMAGEKAKAKELKTKIRAEEERRFMQKAGEAEGGNSEAVALAAAAAEIEENFPQFVKGHEKFNEEATKVVIRMRDGLIATGANAVAALNEAVEFAVRKFGFDEEIKTEEKKDEKVVDLDKKREENTKKKIDASKRQPPEMRGESDKGKKEEKNEVSEMSDEEFNALPESVKRRLRGDFI